MTKSPIDIHNDAVAAAQSAEAQFRAQHGEPFYCGFAWVTIRPATSKFARALKAAGVAKKAYGGGLQVWNPGGSFTQSMDIKEVGAAAYAGVLRAAGIDAYAQSRAD